MRIEFVPMDESIWHSNCWKPIKPSCYNQTIEQVPSYLRAPYILKYYRAHLTIKKCFQSLFLLHNELFDCWSHGLAGLFFWIMTFYLPFHIEPYFFIPSAIFCSANAFVFTISFFAHTLNPINEKIHLTCFQLDWSAIAIALSGNMFSIIYIFFRCDPFQRNICCFFVFIFSIGLFFIANSKKFHEAEIQNKAILSIMPIVPLFIAFFFNSNVSIFFQEFKSKMFLPFIVALIGIIIYGTRIPERFSPGSFDLFLHSHNIHHIWTTLYALLVTKNVVDWSKTKNLFVCT